MSKEELELVSVLEEVLQHDPLANTGAFPCGLCGRRQGQGHYPVCPFMKARKAVENWYARQRGKERTVTEDQEKAIQEVTHAMYQIAVDHGFHEGEVPIRPDSSPEEITQTLKEHMGEYIANLHGEVSELWEAYRDRKLFMKTEKAVDISNAEEELADTMIRCMDTAAALGVNLGRAVRLKSEYNRNRAYKHGGKLA
jgi:NTP pyrophosphatase (non-canonical NTP hydrolase)